MCILSYLQFPLLVCDQKFHNKMQAYESNPQCQFLRTISFKCHSQSEGKIISEIPIPKAVPQDAINAASPPVILHMIIVINENFGHFGNYYRKILQQFCEHRKDYLFVQSINFSFLACVSSNTNFI